MNIWITGAAGFIGSHVAARCLEAGYQVVGIDNMNDYYDVTLKEQRLERLLAQSKSLLQTGESATVPQQPFRFYRLSIEEGDRIHDLMRETKPDVIVHLAAQAGVRYSLTNPQAYIQSNIVGTANILEAARLQGVGHLLYASSSSVYGANKKIPFAVEDRVDHPVSLYAATKKSNELMAHSYSHLYDLPTTGLRFFTVYGPWGRPDMAYFSFAERITSGKPIDVFNFGNMMRDFTYIDDIVEGIMRLLPRAPQRDGEQAPYKLYNIGNHQPVPLLDFIRVLEKHLGVRAELVMKEMQPGDVPQTYADISSLQQDIDFRPDTTIEVGIQRFAEWYLTYKEQRTAERVLHV
ncbi:NAD-dependent epimerase [Paenibacillus arenosi]|uniref:NAD-dependent epimerase n=1 Tax=Paenibacillus arenosi TaxID=2774142 RepID=A0ABR9AW16_9BACL|nr:NAD-dependent epimerase [Paenibacillus arenosi]MBD8498331.1 NAD-dependent epimerase [Paenibacillus arenosi]